MKRDYWIIRGTNSEKLLEPLDPMRQVWRLRWTHGEDMIATTCVQPTLEDIKHIILEWHNEEINKEILSGHRWRDMLVWLSPENQQNYKASFDLAMLFGGQGGTLPLVYKFGSELKPVYHQFNDLEELKEFYLSTVDYVKDTLAKGWKRKDDIDWTPYEQALQAYR